MITEAETVALITVIGGVAIALIKSTKKNSGSLKGTQIAVDTESQIISDGNSNTINYSKTKHIHNYSPPTQLVVPTFQRSDYKNYPEARQIHNAIDNAPSFQKDDVAASYEGNKIDWILFFHSLDKKQDGLISVKAFPSNKINAGLVIFDISVNKFPAFRSIHRGTAINIVGKIIKGTHTAINIEVQDVEVISNLPIDPLV